MFHLQEASKKEIKRIALGVVAGTAIMMLIFYLCKEFNLAVLLGGLLGAAAAIGNFVYLAISVEKAVEAGDRSAAVMKSSYSLRMLVSALAIGLGLLLDFFNPFAIVIPMLLPRITIYALQFTGIYRPENTADSGKKGGE
ncbi:MAG: ATP synthase subunit I [Eubacteriales bacterium]